MLVQRLGRLPLRLRSMEIERSVFQLFLSGNTTSGVSFHGKVQEILLLLLRSLLSLMQYIE